MIFFLRFFSDLSNIFLPWTGIPRPTGISLNTPLILDVLQLRYWSDFDHIRTYYNGAFIRLENPYYFCTKNSTSNQLKYVLSVVCTVGAAVWWFMIYTGWPKKLGTIILYAVTLPNINRFSRSFHCQNKKKICNKDPTTPQLCCCTTLRNIKCLKTTIENNTTSVTTHFKKLTTGSNVMIVSVVVQINCHILQFLHQMFNVSAVLLDDALL